jgi:DUF1680 family protein
MRMATLVTALTLAVLAFVSPVLADQPKAVSGSDATAVANAKAKPKRGSISNEDVQLELTGPVSDYFTRVTEQWLLVAPEANPAILGMFRDRDRRPYRDLLPWSGEFAGKYLTGASQVYRVTRDPRLKARLEAFVADWIPLQDSDGYLGPFPKNARLTGVAPNITGKDGPTWDAWGHYHAILGLLFWNEVSGSAEALNAAKRIGDLFCNRFLGKKSPRLVDTGSTEMNLAPAHALCLLHERTGDARYLELARQIVDEFAATDAAGQPLAGDYLRRGLAGEPFFKTPKPRWESLHPMLALVELHRITGDPSYRTAFENLWWSIAELDRHNNGGFSSGEQAQGNPYHRGAIETCCTIAWTAATVEMLRLTHNPIIADELELSTLNSGLGMFSPSGRWSTYDTPMDGVRKANFHDIVFQARPGSPELNCCSVNAARGLGMIGDWAATREDDGLSLNYYGLGSISARLSSGKSVKLVQETNYPRSGEIRIQVEPSADSLEFTIRLRIPHWSNQTSVKLNDAEVDGVSPGTYLALTRHWKAGDQITLSFDMSPHLWVGERECQGFSSIYRGPVLLTYDRRFNSIDPSEIPALDARDLKLSPVSSNAGPLPIVLVDVPTIDGRTLRLCDFASAGADGSPYLSWLKVEHASASPFSRQNPRRSGSAH